MALRRLADPILNDLVLMINGRKNVDLASPAVSRYTLHLARLDDELAAARQHSGNYPIRADDTVVTIAVRELNELKGAIVTAREQRQAHEAEAGDLRLAKAAYEALINTLFGEFGDELRTLEAPTPTDAILALLRAWRPDVGRGHASAADPALDDARNADAGAGAGPAIARPPKRRAG
jgi:hypothetical protein